MAREEAQFVPMKDEQTISSHQSDSKSKTPDAVLRHAGEVMPGLWVGDIKSVSFINDLVRMSTKAIQDNQKPMVTITVISVMSSTNLLKYVADLLEGKQKQSQQSGCNETENTAASTNSSDLNSIDIHHIKVSLRDSVDADLISVLNNTLPLIDEALGIPNNSTQRSMSEQNDSTSSETPNTINHVRICLVHCAKGASRSVSVVIGYLLSRYPHDFHTFECALDHVRTVRIQAMPNVRFAIDLRKYAKNHSIYQNAFVRE